MCGNAGSCRYRAMLSVVLAMGLLVLMVGCRAKEPLAESKTSGIADGMTRDEKAVEDGRVSVTAACARESYATARQGLIVEESDLREDVLLLRDRVTYKAVPYRLDAAQRLETKLQEEAGAGGHPAKQRECIRLFAEHLQTLTAPLVEAEKEEKDLDASAFKEAAKEAQEELPKEPSAKEQPTER